MHSLVEKFLTQRQEYYDDIPEADYNSDNESLDSDTEYAIDERNIQSLPSTSGHDWRKFLLVRGKPGTGKTFAVLHSIRTALEAHYKVLCATPTGMLSSTCNSIIPDEGFNADTIHSAFKYPVIRTKGQLLIGILQTMTCLLLMNSRWYLLQFLITF